MESPSVRALWGRAGAGLGRLLLGLACLGFASAHAVTITVKGSDFRFESGESVADILSKINNAQDTYTLAVSSATSGVASSASGSVRASSRSGPSCSGSMASKPANDATVSTKFHTARSATVILPGLSAHHAHGSMERFSNKMAIAPTASISIICGNASPGIEPYAANAFTQKTLSGSFQVRNKYLKQLLAGNVGYDYTMFFTQIVDNDV